MTAPCRAGATATTGTSGSGEPYAEAMERIFELYSEGLERLRAWAPSSYPRRDEPEAVWRALDQGEGARRDARPAARGVAQPRRRVRVRPGLRAARCCACWHRRSRRRASSASWRCVELRKVIPAFVKRVDMPDRGGAWIDYLGAGARAGIAGGRALRARRRSAARGAASVRLAARRGAEGDLLAACLYEASDVAEEELRAAVARARPAERAG